MKLKHTNFSIELQLFCPRKNCPCYQSLDNKITKDDTYTTKWIVTHLPFDQLYFCGKNRPIYISIAPKNSLAITLLEQAPAERRIPKNIKKEQFSLKE